MSLRRAGGPFTSLGMGHLWMLDAGGEGEGALSFLFTKDLVTLEKWPEWAKMPQTWRVRKLGEGMDLATAEELNLLSAVEKAERKLARMARAYVNEKTTHDEPLQAAEALYKLETGRRRLGNKDFVAIGTLMRDAISKARAELAKGETT